MRDDSTPSTEVPLCACGCGKPSPVYAYTWAAKGMKKGEHAKYCKGHNGRKYATTEERKAAKRQDYQRWVERHRGRVSPADRLRTSRYSTEEERQEAQRQSHLRMYARRRAAFSEFMQGRVCQDCGESNRKRLHWHHRDPQTKTTEVAHLVNVAKWETVMAEVEKCDLLCISCHWQRHREMRSAQSNVC